MDALPEKELIERYLAAYNQLDVDGMLAVLAPDVRFEHWSGDALAVASDGIDAFRTLAEQALIMFSAREQKVTALAARGDVLVAQIDWRGTLAVAIPDGPAAGTELGLRGESEFGFADGKIARIVDRG